MASVIKINPETGIEWTDSGGDETLTATSVAVDEARIGDEHNFEGAGLRPGRYLVLLTFKWGVGLAVDDALMLYMCRGDGTKRDSGLGATDADMVTEVDAHLNNLLFIGTAICVVATNTTEVVKWFEFESSAEYLSPIILNKGTAALSAVASDFSLIIYPVPFEAQ